MATANATWPPPPPPPSPPPPAVTSVGCEDAEACSYFDVSDSEIVTSLGIFAAMGAVLLVTFGAIRHQAPIFFGRRRLRNLVRGGQSARDDEKRIRESAYANGVFLVQSFQRLYDLRFRPARSDLPLFSDLEPGTETANAQTHRPPPIPRPDGTWSDAVFGWMTHVLRVPDKELVATAGIDALAFIRVCQFGIQLFFPITVLSICVFIPVHASGNSLDQEREDFLALGGQTDKLRSGLNSRLMRTTAANINDADPVMWLHVVTNWLIVVYATWLLRRHTRTFALLRQLYLTTAGDTNLWRAVHMPTTILQQMLVQGREVEAEMDVHAMREQVASRDMRRSGDEDEDEDEDEDDASRDDDDDAPPRDLSPTSSMKKKKKFHEKLDMKSGISHGSATRRRDAEEDDGFEFDVGAGSAGLSRFAPSNASTPEGLHVSTKTDGAKGSAPEGDDSVTIDVAADRLEKNGPKRSQMRSSTARTSLSYAGARESVTFSDDMTDLTVSAGKLKSVRPLRAEGDARHAHREPRVGGMSIEAMAFLATPVLQQSGDAAGENKVISRIKRGLGPKRTGPAIELPKEPKERERVPTVPEGAEEGAEASSSPRMSPGEKPSFRGAVGAVSASTAFDGLGREARRSRGGLKELRNNIKGLKKQQAAKAKAAARGELSSLGVDAATGDVRERGETASMAGAANDAYATPGVSARGSGSSARARASLEYAAPPRASSGSSAGKEAREKEAQTARTAPSTTAGETPEPTTSPSPPKKKKLKVPKGMRIGLQAAKAKVAARRDEKAAGAETAAAPGGGETAAPAGVSETAAPSVSETAAPGGGTSTASAPAAVPPAPSRPPPPDLASPPAGMRIGLASRKTRVPAAETPPAPGPVTESFDPESNRGETRGGEPGSGEPGSGSGLVRRALVPASPESAARPPTVYAGRDGTPTVYFGPDGGEGAQAAAAAAASRRHTADAGYLERLRQNRTGPAPSNPHAPTSTQSAHNPPPGYSANLPPYASPPRHRGVPGQPRRVDGSVMMGVPSFQLDTSRHVIPPPETLSRHGSSKDSLADSEMGSGDGSLTGAQKLTAEEKKRKGKHRRNSSAPTKEYLTTLGFGGVGLDEAFDLGGNRTQRLKEAEAREAERFERMREIAEEEKKKSATSEHGQRTNAGSGATQKNIGARLDSILSGIGKTPGKPTLGANPPVGGSSGRTPSRHNRRGSTGLLLFDAAAALASDPQVAQRNQVGFRRLPSGSDLAGGDVGDGDVGDGDAIVPVSGVSSRGESRHLDAIVSLENRQTTSGVPQKTISKLDRTSRMPGPAVDHIGGGSVSPLLASDVKRVLEHVADAHRARHRRQRSAESGGRGSGSNSNSNSPSHSRTGSFRDLSVMDPSRGSGSPSDGDDRDLDQSRRAGSSSRKPSAEDADFFDGWVGSEDEDAPDVAIDHEWWAGLNIDEDSDDDPDHNPERFEAYYVDPKTEDYEGSRHGVRGSLPDAFLPSGKMPRGVAVDGSSRMSYEDDVFDDPTRSRTIKHAPDAMDAMERGDAKSASAAKAGARAARMVEMPVPDVNARRTVNTYDPDSQKLVSVWAANYTVLMTDLVPVRSSDGTERFPTEAVEAMFANLFPDEFRGIIPVFDHRPVDRLLDQRDELLNVLNKCVEKQRRSYQTTYTKRDWRVMTSVDAARADLEQCERAVVLAREAVLAGEPGPSCFAVFATQKAAAEAAQCLLHSGSRRNFRVQPAPGPDNVNWQTLLYRRHQSLYRIFLISPLIAFILLFPSGIFTVGIASACVGEDVPTSLDWYCSEDAKGFQIFVSGLLPPILLTLWEVFVVSFFLMYCVQAQNVHASLSSTDRRFLRYYYVWGFANVLLGGITGGALTTFAQDVLGQDNTTYSIQKHLGRILPISSNFFLVFVFFRSVYLPIQRLILPHPGIICWAVRRYLCVFGCAVTPRDRTVKYSPRGLRMGREVGVFLMVAMLGLTFCLTAPMMAPACLLFFVANFVVWRYHVLYVYERGWESNGSMWFTVVELVVWSLLVAQSFMSCVLFSKSAYLEGIALYLTIPYYLYKYVVSIKAEFGSGNSWSVPLGEAAKAPPADFSAEIYTHPSLRPAAMGWHPDVGKVWRGYPGVAVKHTL